MSSYFSSRLRSITADHVDITPAVDWKIIRSHNRHDGSLNDSVELLSPLFSAYSGPISSQLRSFQADTLENFQPTAGSNTNHSKNRTEQVEACHVHTPPTLKDRRLPGKTEVPKHPIPRRGPPPAVGWKVSRSSKEMIPQFTGNLSAHEWNRTPHRAGTTSAADWKSSRSWLEKTRT